MERTARLAGPRMKTRARIVFSLGHAFHNLAAQFDRKLLPMSMAAAATPLLHLEIGNNVVLGIAPDAEPLHLLPAADVCPAVGQPTLPAGFYYESSPLSAQRVNRGPVKRP